MGDVSALAVDDLTEGEDFFAELRQAGFVVVAHVVVAPVCLVLKGEILVFPVPGAEQKVAYAYVEHLREAQDYRVYYGCRSDFYAAVCDTPLRIGGISLSFRSISPFHQSCTPVHSIFQKESVLENPVKSRKVL